MSLETSRTDLGAHFSEGARLLWKAVGAHGTQAAVTKLIGAKPGVLTRWLYGDVRPRWEWAGRMRDKLGIPLDAWDARPRAPFKLPANKAA